MILYYKSFANDVCVDFIGIRCTNIVFAQGGSPDRVGHTHFVIRSDKIPCKVVAIVCRRFKTNDEAVLLEGIEIGNQQLEAITVVRELKRLDEYFAFIRNDCDEMFEFGNINASVKHHIEISTYR